MPGKWHFPDEMNVESNNFMIDLIFIGIVVAFFVASALYVRFCEKL